MPNQLLCNPQNYKFTTGEKHQYLGDSYRLNVKQSLETGVILQKNEMILNVNNALSIEHKEFVLDMWYRKEARSIFIDALAKAIVKAAPYTLTVPDLEIYRLENRWGACSPKSKRIIMNLELIKTPKICIEYIALHEVLHFSYPNHNLSFYGALGNLMADWKEREDLLKHKYSLT